MAAAFRVGDRTQTVVSVATAAVTKSDRAGARILESDGAERERGAVHRHAVGGDIMFSNGDAKNQGAGIAVGIAIGVALGVAMDNLAIGIAIGVAIGVALSQSMKGSAKE